MRATRAVPSAPRIACGVSIWISNRTSSDSQIIAMASTCRTDVTFGSVTRKPPAGQCLRGRADVAILLVVRSDAVTVLEIDAQILDRFGCEFGAHTRLHRAEVGQRAVLVQGGQRGGSPLRDGARVEPVCRDVHGVHRPASGRWSRIGASPLGVVTGQHRVDAGGAPAR